jgi:hypothetical protein
MRAIPAVLAKRRPRSAKSPRIFVTTPSQSHSKSVFGPSHAVGRFSQTPEAAA